MKIPEFLLCGVCQGEYVPEIFLEHLEEHHIFLDKDICTHIPIYNDERAAPRTIQSTADHNLFSIVNDGRFHGFQKVRGSDNSTDNTKKIVTSFPNTMFFEHGVVFEEEKFNFAFHLAAKMGFKIVILLGSDEWIVGNLSKMKQKIFSKIQNLSDPFEEQIFQVAIDEHQPENKWNRFITESPKVFYNPGLIRTRFSHWLRYSATQIARDHMDHPFYNFQRRLCEIVIHHDDSIRGKERNDLMTKFQDRNVQREKKRIQTEAYRKLFQFTFLLSERKLADWHRSFFLNAKDPYSHFLVYDEGIKLSRKIVNQIHASLLNNPDKNIDILSAVYQLDNKKNWRVNSDIPEKKFLTQKIKEIHTNAKFESRNRYHTLTLGLGPILAIRKNVVKEIESISDKKTFLALCRQKGFRIMCDSGIQVKLEEKIAAIPKAN